MNNLNSVQLETLKQEPITKQAMKETGLTFDEMMAVKLTVPDEDVFTRASWSIGWSGKLDPYHIAPLQKFAILRWYYSAEAGAPGNEQLRQAASMFVHTATLGTYADDGNAWQHGRSYGGSTTAKEKQAEALDNIEDTRRRWEKLAKDGRPERERAGIIATQTGSKVNTVREWIRKAGLR